MSVPRLLCIGAHPDDCEFQCSGLAALVSRSGGTVRFLSVTDGSRGHHLHEPTSLVAIRRKEALAEAKLVGADAVNLGFQDGWLFPTAEVRAALITQIRRFNPDVVVCPRPNDYRPDHRATGVAVQDAGYLLMVPNIIADIPVPETRPVIIYMSDRFSLPNPFRPDVVFDIGSVVADKLAAILAHRSQVYEWLPVINGFADQLPKSEPELTAYLRDRETAKIAAETELFRAKFASRYAYPVRYGEAYQLSEYGAEATAEEVYQLLGV